MLTRIVGSWDGAERTVKANKRAARGGMGASWDDAQGRAKGHAIGVKCAHERVRLMFDEQGDCTRCTRLIKRQPLLPLLVGIMSDSGSKETVVIGMGPNPDPDDHVASSDPESAIVVADADAEPIGTAFEAPEMQRRMLGIQ